MTIEDTLKDFEERARAAEYLKREHAIVWDNSSPEERALLISEIIIEAAEFES